jgi:hypothetical protein
MLIISHAWWPFVHDAMILPEPPSSLLILPHASWSLLIEMILPEPSSSFLIIPHACWALLMANDPS